MTMLVKQKHITSSLFGMRFRSHLIRESEAASHSVIIFDQKKTYLRLTVRYREIYSKLAM